MTAPSRLSPGTKARKAYAENQGEMYYRHVEFQARPDPEMATRCFRYNTQLFLQFAAPVVTTVLYLFPPKPKQELMIRIVIDGREVNRWSFEHVYLCAAPDVTDTEFLKLLGA